VTANRVERAFASIEHERLFAVKEFFAQVFDERVFAFSPPAGYLAQEHAFDRAAVPSPSATGTHRPGRLRPRSADGPQGRCSRT
jgi:hypothetical protein